MWQPSRSRRHFLNESALTAAAGLGAPWLAQAVAAAPSADAANAPAMINANEYPGGRYLGERRLELLQTSAAQLGVGIDHLMAYAGSTEPLDYTMLAFASPRRAARGTGRRRPHLRIRRVRRCVQRRAGDQRCCCARTTRTTCRRCAPPAP